MKRCCKVEHLCSEKSDKLGGFMCYAKYLTEHLVQCQVQCKMQLKPYTDTYTTQMAARENHSVHGECCCIHQVFYRDCHRPEPGMISVSNHISHCMTLALLISLFSIKMHVRVHVCVCVCVWRGGGKKLITQMSACKTKAYHTEMTQ